MITEHNISFNRIDQITPTKQAVDEAEIITSYNLDDDINDDIDDDDIDDDSGPVPGSGEHKAFQFTIFDGQVTEVFEIKDGIPEPKSIDDDGSETYTVEGTEVVRTELEPFGTEITRYADMDGDSLYHRISEQWISGNTESGPFKIQDNLKFLPTDGNDLIAVRGGEDCNGSLGADNFVFREAAHLRIGDFNSSEGDLLVFDTGLGLTSVEHLASFVTQINNDGQNLIVDFGPEASVTLVGVQPDQISWDHVTVLS